MVAGLVGVALLAVFVVVLGVVAAGLVEVAGGFVVVFVEELGVVWLLVTGGLFTGGLGVAVVGGLFTKNASCPGLTFGFEVVVVFFFVLQKRLQFKIRIRYFFQKNPTPAATLVLVVHVHTGIGTLQIFFSVFFFVAKVAGHQATIAPTGYFKVEHFIFLKYQIFRRGRPYAYKRSFSVKPGGLVRIGNPFRVAPIVVNLNLVTVFAAAHCQISGAKKSSTPYTS